MELTDDGRVVPAADAREGIAAFVERPPSFTGG